MAGVGIEDITERALLCRDLGHRWDFVTDARFVYGRGRDPVEMTRQLECDRCTATKETTYALPSFDVLHTARTYPESYLFSGRGRASKTEVRQEELRRLFGQTARGRGKRLRPVG